MVGSFEVCGNLARLKSVTLKAVFSAIMMAGWLSMVPRRLTDFVRVSCGRVRMWFGRIRDGAFTLVHEEFESEPAEGFFLGARHGGWM